MNVVDPGGSSSSSSTSSGRPGLLQTIIAAARRFGADPVLMVATAMRESGLNWDAVGDNGTSFGPFQHHRGGALGAHDPAWAMSPAGVEERAAVFAAAHAHTGADAAAIQRPADPTAYARSVDSYLPQARKYVEFVDNGGDPLTYAGQDLGGVSGVGPAQVVGGIVSGAGAAASAAGSVVGSLFDWGALRRVVLAAVLVAGGVAMVVSGGYQATKA